MLYGEWQVKALDESPAQFPLKWHVDWYSETPSYWINKHHWDKRSGTSCFQLWPAPPRSARRSSSRWPNGGKKLKESLLLFKRLPECIVCQIRVSNKGLGEDSKQTADQRARGRFIGSARLGWLRWKPQLKRCWCWTCQHLLRLRSFLAYRGDTGGGFFITAITRNMATKTTWRF